MSGFGTVVTGTLTDGDLKIGDEIEVLPAGLHGRVRGLQTHKQKEDAVHPGQRTAVNISGIDVDEIQRGDTISLPGAYKATRRIDAEFRFLSGDMLPLRHHHEVKFFLGAKETRAFVRLLHNEELKPGETSFIQLDLVEPIVARKGDRFILRRPSPAETLGGGGILDPHPKRRYRRFDDEVEQNLRTKKEGTPSERLLQAIEMGGPSTLQELVSKTSLSKNEVDDLLLELINEKLILSIDLGKSVDQKTFVSTKWINDQTDEIVNYLERYHMDNPLRAGIPREELKNRTGINPKLFTVFLSIWLDQGFIKEESNTISMASFRIKFNQSQQTRVNALLEQFTSTPFAPPSVKECVEAVGTPIYEALLNKKSLVQISDDVVFTTKDFAGMKNKTIAILQEKQKITLAEFRDEFSTSRKYAQAVLEYLDQINVTLRQGDFRVLNPKSQRSADTTSDMS